MRLEVVQEGVKEDNKSKKYVNTITYDELFSTTYSSVDINKLVEEYKDQIIDTLIIKDHEKNHSNKLSVIHLTNNGHILINYVNKNNESSTKIYTNIIDNSATFNKDGKILYDSEKLNCIFVKLDDSIVLLNLINFKRYNKIIERDMDSNSRLHLVENDNYVVLLYIIDKLIKVFLWDAQTKKYLRLNVIDTGKIKKFHNNGKLVDISFAPSEHNNILLLLFETNIFTYDLLCGEMISEKPTLNIKRLKHFHSDVIKLLDTSSPILKTSDSSGNVNQTIKFIKVVRDSYKDIIVVDNYGNLYKYMYGDKNSNMLLMFDKLLLHNAESTTISNVQYENDDLNNNILTMYVYSNNNKLLNICYNNYSIITLNANSYKLDRDFMIEFNSTDNRMNVSKINYKNIIEINNLTIHPMNLINLINKIYYSTEKLMSDQEYLDMIRSSYSKLILLQSSIAKENDAVLTFFNKKAIKYLLPLDVVVSLNTGNSYNKLFINYLVEVKRYLKNIEKDEATKYNKFFNNKIIVNDFKFFIYNEELELEERGNINDLIKSIDEKLFYNYLKKDLKMLELFIISDTSMCRVDKSIVLNGLLGLLKDQNSDIVAVLKLIIKYTIFIESYKEGLEIIINLNSYLHIEVPSEYINQLLISFLIEAFPSIVVNDNKSYLEIFFAFLQKIPNHESPTILSSVLLQNKPLDFNEDLFDDLIAHIEALNKNMVITFLEYYSIFSNSNRIVNKLISYYITVYTDKSLEKLYDLLLNNAKKYDPFEVMIQLNNKIDTTDNLIISKSLSSCKLLLWKQLKEDGKILNYQYYEKGSLGACFEYINTFMDNDVERFQENIQNLYEILIDPKTGDKNNYDHWLLFLQEYNKQLDISQIPDFIKVNDVQLILVKKLTHSLTLASRFNQLLITQEKIVAVQEKYKYSKYINQFQEIL